MFKFYCNNSRCNKLLDSQSIVYDPDKKLVFCDSSCGSIARALNGDSSFPPNYKLITQDEAIDLLGKGKLKGLEKKV